MKSHIISVSYTFKGRVKVYAKNKQRAKEIVKNDFGVVLGRAHTSNSSDETEEGIVDWDINTHPNITKID